MASNHHSSLLQEHKDTLTYQVADPGEQKTDRWIELGIFDWEFETVPIGTSVPDNPSEAELETIMESASGIGFRINFHAPKYNPPKDTVKEVVSEVFDVYSTGFRAGEGYTFRTTDAKPQSVRRLGRRVALTAFAYWWWVENKSTYDKYVQRVTNENSQPTIETVTTTGVVIHDDGEKADTPYELPDVTLKHASECKKPVEQCEKALMDVVERLVETHHYTTVEQACRNIQDNFEQYEPSVKKTNARVREEKLNEAARAVRRIDGIGRTTELRIKHKFDDIVDLCQSIRTQNDDRLRQITQITPEREGKIIDVLQHSELFVTQTKEQQSDTTE